MSYIPRLNTTEGKIKYKHDLDTKLLNLNQAGSSKTWFETLKLECVQTIIRQAGKASTGL